MIVVGCPLIVIVVVDVVVEVWVPPGATTLVLLFASVLESLLVRVETYVVAFATIEEYVICVESVKFPARAVTLCVGAKRNTISWSG